MGMRGVISLEIREPVRPAVMISFSNATSFRSWFERRTGSGGQASKKSSATLCWERAPSSSSPRGAALAILVE
jgi:hypothetical protein